MAEEVLSRVEDIIVRNVDIHSSGCVSMLLCRAQAESGWGQWVHPSTVVSSANYIEKRKVYACFWSGLFKVPHKQRYRHPSQKFLHFLTTLHKPSFHEKQASPLHLFGKMCARWWYGLFLAGDTALLRKQTGLFLENESVLLHLLTQVEGVLMATLLVKLFCCCSPLWSTSLTDSWLEHIKLEQSC